MANRRQAETVFRATIEAVVRKNYGRLLAILIHQFSDIELAEDALQDALLAALGSWNAEQMPANPSAWLLQTARNKAIDRLRRIQVFSLKTESLQREIEQQNEAGIDMTQIPDERLRLIFTCCHPALSRQTRVALTLKTLCGLTTQQVASAFVVSETTMAQRLVRAKKKIKTAGIPYQVPAAPLLGERLPAVLAVIYFIFNEGYFCSTGVDLVSREFCDEAINLAETMLGLMPNETEIHGLLALMLFHHSRFESRVDIGGDMVDLETQNRTLWDRELIARADKLIVAALMTGQAGTYQLQAAISAVHAHSTSFAATDWKQIVMLYLRLENIDSNPVIRLNLAVALSYAETPETGLSYLDQIADLDRMQNYPPYFAARASMQRRLGNDEMAVELYRSAIALCDNQVEKAYLKQKCAAISEA